ncbi:cytochrome oxidase subunit II [compost metagenome]
MWLIIAIVILFVAFPRIYTTMSVHLHIPLAVMLIGIIARGTAFVFRHYDAVKDDMQWLYNRIFRYSSFLTALFLGIIAGSVLSGKVDPDATNFADAYIFSWFNWFSISVGLFTTALCGFLAAIYLKGGGVISLYNTIGPEKTVQSLGWALVLGSFLILPFLGYLFYKFQQKEE